jgi:ADP-heptose:LPS heptosyltransferase
VQDSDVNDARRAERRDTRPNRRSMGMVGMRWVDHWVGLPLCFLLGLFVTAVRKLGLRRSRSISGDRVLAVFKFFGLGSILEATPLVRAIRQRYPQARLAFVTFEGNETLVRRLNVCTDLRVIRVRSPIHFVLDVLREIIWLQRQRVEAVVDLEFFSKFSTLLAFFSGARVRIGFHLNDFWRYRLVTHPVYFNYYRHITDVYRQVARRLDTDIEDLQLSRVDPGAEARRSVERFLRLRGWSASTPLLGVNINAGDLCLERRWPLDRYTQLIETLLEKHPDLRVVLTGTPDERGYVFSLVDGLSAAARSRVLVTAGEWSLQEFVAALSFFCGFVTNDSGPMHLAAAEGVAMVSLWGPGRPAFYAPQHSNHHVIYSDYDCSPCLYMFTTFEAMWCRHEAWCMQAIAVPTVLEAVESILSGQRGG